MKSNTPLDYAVFQLSPKRSRCELFVSSDGNTEKLASGLVNPFVTHLKVAEEQVALAVQSIKLEVERRKNAETWFTKGTLERFLQFVSTPEVLELVNTFDAEMSQLEIARRIYSQEVGDKFPGTLSGDRVGATAAADSTKKELLRAIDVRLVAVRQDLITACSRAASVGFTPGAVSELQLFADQFGASRLNEACRKFILLCERQPDLIIPWKDGAEDRTIQSSYRSDMSINEDHTEEQLSGFHQSQLHQENKQPAIREPDTIQKQQQHHLEQLKPSICQQPKASSVPISIQRSRESSIDKDNGRGSDSAAEKLKKEESIDQIEWSQTSQPARRLSVQDRISLFENKQKENSGSGGKSLVGRSVELQRLSSDVSSAPAVVEKAVLRRWSGASDMNIDLNGEKEIESPLCTPSSSSVSQTKSDDQKGLNETTSSSKPKLKNVTSRVGSKETANSRARVGVTCGREEIGTKVGTNSVDLTVSSVRSDDASESNKLVSTLGRVEKDGWKDQTCGKIQSRSSSGRAEDNILKDQATSQTQVKSLPGGRAEQFGLMDQGKFRGSMGDEEQGGKGRVASETQIAGLEDLAVPPTQFGSFASRQSDVRSSTVSYDAPHSEFLPKVEDVGLKDHSVSLSRFRSPLRTAMDYRQSGGGSDLKTQEASASQCKGTEDDSLASQRRRRSLVEVKEVSKKGLPSSEKQLHDSGPQRMKFEKQVSSSEQIKKSQGRRNERCSDYESSKTLFSVKMVSEGQEEGFGSIPTVSLQQVQKVRQSKGKQELNDELKMKANEIEKLFVEHKLRIPGDQSSSTQRSKPSEMQVEQVSRLPYRIPAVEIAPEQLPGKNIVADPTGSSRNAAKFNASSLMKMVDNQGYGDALKQKFSELGFPDDSRGKFYGRYMQKRDAKLMEEWDFDRAEKEVRMKAMQDSLELSRAEMKAKLSGTADRQDSLYCIRRHAERLRSFNTRSFMQEQLLDIVQCEDEDLSEFAEQKPFVHDMSFGETSFGDYACRRIQTKKHLPNRNWSSSTPRTSAAPVARSAVKASNCSSGRRRMESENPLAQLVTNFSDLRKENTKPSSGVSKSTTSPKFRRYSLSKSTCEYITLVKEEKPQWSQSWRKGSASSTELKDASPLNSEGIVLTPLKFDKDQTEQNLYHKFTKNVESKPFLGNNNGIPHGDGAGIAKLRASLASEPINHEEESDELAFEPEDFVDVVKDVEELETITTNNHIMDNRIPRSSQESYKKFNSGFENGDALRFFSQVDLSLVAELSSAVPSTFHPVGSEQDSQGESPMSWNAHMPHSCSYPHETSDIGAFADSPIVSPVSGNSHSLNQTEADAARMRNKWGSAQKPILVANSSPNQCHRDMTKGFKRLPKFGRKTCGTESLVDWISATTSEGDDDTEDGRDHVNQSSRSKEVKNRIFPGASF